MTPDWLALRKLCENDGRCVLLSDPQGGCLPCRAALRLFLEDATLVPMCQRCGAVRPEEERGQIHVSYMHDGGICGGLIR